MQRGLLLVIKGKVLKLNYYYILVNSGEGFKLLVNTVVIVVDDDILYHCTSIYFFALFMLIISFVLSFITW